MRTFGYHVGMENSAASLQRTIRHWWPSVVVSFGVNSVLLYALGMRLAPSTLAFPDAVISIELVNSAAAQRASPARPAVTRRVPPDPPTVMPATAQTAPSPSAADEAVGSTQAAQGGAQPGIEPLYRVTRLPAFIRRVEPSYPEAERAREKEARVVAVVVIDDHGRVVEIQIAQSGGPAFDAAVIDALNVSTFSPAYIGARAVNVRLTVPFQFKLD